LGGGDWITALVATIMVALVTAIATDAWSTARTSLVRLLFQRFARRRDRRASRGSTAAGATTQRSLAAHQEGPVEPPNVSSALTEQASTMPIGPPTTTEQASAMPSGPPVMTEQASIVPLTGPPNEQASTGLPNAEQSRVPAGPVVHVGSAITIVNTGVIQGNVNIDGTG
jgi:hypothetical protein